MPEKPCVKVWPFADAPDELKALSRFEGREQYLALVPPHWDESGLNWLQYATFPGSPFGSFDVDEIRLKDGSTVYIGAHS